MTYISLDAKMTSNTTEAQCLCFSLFTEKNEIFYAELIDCYPTRIESNDYLLNSVIPKLKYISLEDIYTFWEDTNNNSFNKIEYSDTKSNNVHIYGTSYFVFQKLKEWLEEISNEDIIFIVDHNYLSFLYLISTLKMYNNNLDYIYISSGIIDLNILLAILSKTNVDNSILKIDRDLIIRDNDILLSGNDTSIAVSIRNMKIFELIKDDFGF